MIERVGQVSAELGWIERLERTLGLLLEWHEHACFTVDDDFRNAADVAGDDRRAARHCLQVDDAEGLVDRRAAEHGRVAVQLDGRFARQHLLDPDHPFALALSV